VLANQLFFAKADLPPPLANRLIRLAAFQNPEFYRAQAMRLPVWNKPRVIGCAENYPQHIALPRGCLDAVVELLEENGVGLEIHDERLSGEPVEASFAGRLRPDEETAASAMLAHDIGVLCAPTAFGKMITAAAIITRRGVNTLVLVHRTELLGQWRERLRAFLDIGNEMIGVIGGGQRQPTGKIDIAVMQSLSRKGEISDRIEGYGQVIVDECHHLSAFSFEAILKRARAKYVLGLTATPVRRDGQHPIIFMQCGPVRHTALRPQTTLSRLSVWPRQLDTCLNITTEAGIQERFRQLAADPARNARIVADTLAAYREGRKVLLLTERTEHLDNLCQALAPGINNLFVLHGRMSKKRRTQVLAALESLQDEAPRVLLATGRLVGEGFDHPPLDTLILAMPIAWKGTLQQYAGHLHRAHALKSEVRILDYIDNNDPVFMRMWEKRQRGYRAMGYEVVSDSEDQEVIPPQKNLPFQTSSSHRLNDATCSRLLYGLQPYNILSIITCVLTADVILGGYECLP
jgi:superfamily II DNA or RNA helicase